MTFYQAYKDQGSASASLGPLRDTAEEALEDLRDNGYFTDKLKPFPDGCYYSPAQQIGVSVTHV